MTDQCPISDEQNGVQEQSHHLNVMDKNMIYMDLSGFPEEYTLDDVGQILAKFDMEAMDVKPHANGFLVSFAQQQKAEYCKRILDGLV